MKTVNKILLAVMLISIPFGASAQGIIKGPKKPSKEATTKAKKKTTAKASAKSNPSDRIFKKGLAAYSRQDYQEAFRLYSEAADMGNIDAMYQVAGMYYEGKGVGQDYEAAAKLYRKLSDMGDAMSMYRLAILYEEGNGVPKDLDEALILYKKSVANGNPWAQVDVNRLKKTKK